MDELHSPAPEWRAERRRKYSREEQIGDEVGDLRRDMTKMLTLLTDMDKRLTQTQRQVHTLFNELAVEGQKQSHTVRDLSKPAAPN